MDSSETVRIGIVGLGGIGHHHAQRFEKHDAQLVGGMDIAADARDDFEREFGVQAFETATQLYERVDAVLVATPNRFHEEYAVEALEAGIDVLLEKPLAHTVESAERIAETARESDAFCMVGFKNRFAAPVEVLKSYEAEGRFGDLTHVEANYVRRRGIPGRGSWFTSEEVAGGGALIDIGVHAVDLALYFLGHPEVVEVSGVTRSDFGGREDYAYVDMWGEDTGPDGFDVEDSASAFIRTAGGKTISLEVAWASNRPNNDEYLLQGTDAGARFDRSDESLSVFESGAGGGHHHADTDVETRDRDLYAEEQRVFLDAVTAGEAPTINTVEEALRVQRIVDAIYESSDTGRAVRLD